MTQFQKVIKYGAIAFAIYLCFIIISIIIASITAIFGISIGFEAFQNTENIAKMQKWEQEYKDITNMDIDLNVAKLAIKKGETFKVEVSNSSNEFQCRVEANELKIKDNKVYKNLWNIEDIIPEVTIFIPEENSLKKVKIETGVNETEIEYLKAEKIDLKMGVGKCNIDSILADYAKIEAGAGESIIDNAKIGELKLNGGIGKLVLNARYYKRS